MSTAIVIKLGGSLADAAGPVLAAVAASGIPALIVPGGGAFADEVRARNPDDDTAHWQAISAMNRYGVFLSTFGYPCSAEAVLPASGLTILLPEQVMKDADPVPHSWDVTSDSIALWIAGQLHAPLLLIKSRSGTFDDPEYIDPYFSVLKPAADIPAWTVNGRDLPELTAFLKNIPKI